MPPQTTSKAGINEEGQVVTHAVVATCASGDAADKTVVLTPSTGKSIYLCGLHGSCSDKTRTAQIAIAGPDGTKPAVTVHQTGGVIDGFTPTDYGSELYLEPSIVIADPDGTGAAAHTSINRSTQVLANVLLDDGGSGYTAPTASFGNAWFGWTKSGVGDVDVEFQKPIKFKENGAVTLTLKKPAGGSTFYLVTYYEA